MEKSFNDEDFKVHLKGLKELIFGKLVGINYTYRFSGSKKIKDQSVAEHSYFVALIAGELAKFENKMAEKYGHVISNYFKATKVDLLKIYEYSLYHDMEEAVVTGDIIHTFKKSFDLELEQKVDEKIKELFYNEMVEIFNGHELYDIWEQSHDKSRIEYFFVKLADYLQLMQYVLEEENLGNKNFEKIREKGINLILDLTYKHEYNKLYVSRLIRALMANLINRK